MACNNKNYGPASTQLPDWYNEHKNKPTQNYTTNSTANPIVSHDVSITVGAPLNNAPPNQPHPMSGPMVIYDSDFFDQMCHFTRERIPERVVHAKGAGAFGRFVVTDDITDLTVAKVFCAIGKSTDIAVRFSQVAGNLGSADTVRDPRGFAVKFYTEDGNWDLVGNNTPIFFMRDPKLFPMFIHSQKRNPSTNILHDWDMFWDYLSLSPQSLHQVLILFSDRGIPDGHRHMHGYGSHTFSMINRNDQLTWVKFHYRTNQGIKNLPPAKADEIAGKDPDYALRDLYNAIAEGDFPTWTLYVQTMTSAQLKDYPFDAFDITKVWSQKTYPLRRVGRIELLKNPINYFAEVEQLAFSPSNFVPGIGPSPDRLLQGRLFAYNDAHRYRLGVNFTQLPRNCPFQFVKNYERDGSNARDNQGAAPNYHPNSFGGPEVNREVRKTFLESKFPIRGIIMDYYDQSEDYIEDSYTQPGTFYRDVLTEEEKGRLAANLADSLGMVSSKEVRQRAVENFARVDADLGRRLRDSLENCK